MKTPIMIPNDANSQLMQNDIAPFRRGGGGGGGGVPYEGGLHARYDFSTPDGYTTNQSSQVISATDLSGNGNDLPSGAGGGQGLIVPWQGLEAANFENRILRNQAYATAPMPYSIFFVGTAIEDDPEGSSNSLTDFVGANVRLSDGSPTEFVLDFAAILEPDWSAGPRALGTPVSYGFTVNAAADAFAGVGTAQRSAVSVAHSSVRDGIESVVSIGMSGTDRECIIGEVLIYTRSLDQSEFDEVMAYLNTKWGIA